MSFVDGPVRVTVPATSANLGPGFDTFGLALSMRDTLTASVRPAGLELTVAGEGEAEVPLDGSHLVVGAMRAAFEAMGAGSPGLRLHCDNVIPHGRGLGSSSAAIVGGVFLARELVAGGRLLLDDAALLALAADLEGHPDNVAPALLGGFVVCGAEEGEWYAVPAGVDPRVRVCVLVPPDPVATERARGLLPAQVPHADAAANAGRAALLVTALAGRPEHLWLATRDWLHQEQRAPAMPATLELVRRLRADRVPAVVSGAGPTVLAFLDAPGAVGGDAASLRSRAPDGWAVHELGVEPAGAQVGPQVG